MKAANARKILKMIDKIKVFFSQVKAELKKTSWPTRRELIDATVVVIIATAILSAYVGAIDVLLSKVVSLVIK